jgi:hypothetical protein
MAPFNAELERLLSEARKSPDDVDKQRALYEAAKMSADTDRFDEALTLARAIFHPELHTTMLAHISARLLSTGDWERSSKVFGEAVASADRVVKADNCPFVINLGMTAHMLAQRGLHEKTLGPIRLSVHGYIQASLLYWTAAGLAVENHIDKALEVANSIRDPLTRGRSFENIAVMLKDRGQKERAADLMKEAKRLLKENAKGDD